MKTKPTKKTVIYNTSEQSDIWSNTTQQAENLPPNVRANSIQYLISELAFGLKESNLLFKNKSIDQSFIKICRPDISNYINSLKKMGVVISKYCNGNHPVFQTTDERTIAGRGYDDIKRASIYPRSGGQDSVNNFKHSYPKTFSSNKCDYARMMFEQSANDIERRKKACILFVISDPKTMLMEFSEKDFFDDFMIFAGGRKSNCGCIHVIKEQCNMDLFKKEIDNSHLTFEYDNNYTSLDCEKNIPTEVSAYIVVNNKKLLLANFSTKGTRNSFYLSCSLPILMSIVCTNKLAQRTFQKMRPIMKSEKPKKSIFDVEPNETKDSNDGFDYCGFNVEIDEETGHAQFVQDDEFVVEEGKKKCIKHLKIERNSALRREYFKINKPPYICGMCKENITQKYSKAPNGARSMVELHHIAPLASTVHPGLTGLKDVILLCRNCHAACHCFIRQWLRNKGQSDFFDIDQARKVLELAIKTMCNIEVTVEVEA